MNINTDISGDFASEGKIYLNNASVSLNPLNCIRSMHNFLVSYNAIGPDSIDSEPFVTQQLRNTRKILSQIIKSRPEEIILTQSTTDGINAVANGMKFDPASNVIIRGLSHEHHANYYPWLRLLEKVELRSLPVNENGFFKIDDLKHFIDKNTKLVALSHALYNTGAILPIDEVGEILEKQNIPYFIDTAQTVGCIGDFDVNKTKCNFMSFNGSKWLCGPMGTGIFYCKKNSKDLLEPLSIGGESAMIFDDTKLAYKDLPEKFQTGFRNYVGIAGLEASVQYLSKYGMENIRKKVIKLANQLRTELAKIPNITLYGPDEPSQRTSIVSFSIKNFEPSEIVEKLEKKKIVLAVREIAQKRLVRASPHFFNSEEQIELLASELRKL